MKRIFDVFLAITAITILGLPMLLIAAMVRITSTGPALYWSQRIGLKNKVFQMPKFRTMQLHTPVVATHLLDKPHRYLTPLGSLLRRYSLDELPQFWSILKGDMSMVGPRPALSNQNDLIALRTQNGLHELIPGLTGLAQINGRDNLSIDQKVELELDYLRRRSFWLDFKIILMTVLKVLEKNGVSH
mgnify:CR=1 FL=1